MRGSALAPPRQVREPYVRAAKVMRALSLKLCEPKSSAISEVTGIRQKEVNRILTALTQAGVLQRTREERRDLPVPPAWRYEVVNERT